MDRPVADYYNHKYFVQPTPSGNNSTKLDRLEKDISLLHEDVKNLQTDISIIKNYIIIKRDRENSKWF